MNEFETAYYVKTTIDDWMKELWLKSSRPRCADCMFYGPFGSQCYARGGSTEAGGCCLHYRYNCYESEVKSDSYTRNEEVI